MFSFIRKIFFLSLLFVFLQVPSFLYLYEAHTIGHYEELKHQVSYLENIAQSFHIDFEQYTAYFLEQKDPKVHKQGEFLLYMKKRLLSFESYAEKMQTFERIPAFFVHFDKDIFLETCAQFRPTLVLNTESILWGLIGTVTTYLLIFFRRRP